MKSGYIEFLAMAPGAPGKAGAGGQQQGGVPGLLVSLFPFILIFVVFYFLIIAPQRKQQKEHDKMLGALKRGDKVITSGGMHGVIADFKEAEKVVVVQVAQNVRVDISRSSITGVKRDIETPQPK